ncbi:glycosyltransferase family 25 protein [Vibrio sp. Isolate24]|uniref:glycosyltransferase family 25 protein n=1 Tax=Vibrio sp. Isolate24 TaxID=2908534 RepID=UPI0023D93509|nr:glycosyltransferase family 25 protein [Vibrio sp. Isolate24]
MKVFIINLPRSIDRRREMAVQLSNTNVVNYEFFDAIDGKSLPAELENLINDRHRVLLRSRPLAPGEKGIYASNYLLWKKCVELNEPILIMEDDVVLEPEFNEVCTKAEQLHLLGYDYFRLGVSDTEEKPKVINDEMQLVHWRDNCSGSTRCYSLSPNGAQKLLDASSSWLCAVDNFVGEAYRTKLPCLGLLPFASTKADYETTIQFGSKSKVPLLFKAFREAYRFYRFIRMTIWNKFQFRSRLPNK